MDAIVLRPAPRPAIPRDFERRGLAPRHRILFRSFAEALYFDPDRPPTDAQLDRAVGEINAYVAFTSRGLRRSLTLVFDLFRFLAPAVIGKPFRAFDDLGPEDRVRALEALEGSKFFAFPLVFAAMKVVTSMTLLEDEAGLAWLGYQHERVLHRRLPLHGSNDARPPSEQEAAE